MLDKITNLGRIEPKSIEGQLILPTPVISPEQCRGARGMLDMSRDELAKASAVAQATIADFETGRRRPYPRTIGALRTALEAAGVEFIAENGGGPGVRLSQKGVNSTHTPASERSPNTAPEAPALRSVGPEDEARGGHEAPADRPGPTVPGTGPRRPRKRTDG